MENIADNSVMLAVILITPLIMFLIVSFFDNKQNPKWLRKTTKIIFAISIIPSIIIGWRVYLVIGAIFGSLVFLIWSNDRNDKIGR